MRRALVLSSLVLAAASAAGCGVADAKARPTSAEAAPDPLEALALATPRHARNAKADLPAEIVPRRRAPVVGALEHPSALRRYFTALAQLESGRGGDVRVVQFGDSHTAADIQTAVVREALQDRFGDGGRGFVALGRPFRGYHQAGVRCGMSGDWSTDHTRYRKGKVSGDGMYGLAGVGLDTDRRGARAWTNVRVKTSRAEIDYLEQPGGGSFDVLIDGLRVVRISTRGERDKSAFRAFEVSPGSEHQIEVRARGDGEVRVFGVSLDRAEPGIVFDALGINGARATTCLTWDEQHWAEQLRHRDPHLVVLAYGTNESGDETSQQTYERHLVDLLGRVARAVPTASCLLLGPPDRAIESDGAWITSSKILEIIASQRRVAEAAGCAFYDQLAAMGGAGTMAAWAAEEPPRAQKDRVHLTREGYAQVGGAFASDMLRAYALFRGGKTGERSAQR